MEALSANEELINGLKKCVEKGTTATGDFIESTANNQSDFYQMLSGNVTQMYLVAAIKDPINVSSLIAFGFHLGVIQEALASMGGVNAWWKVYDHLIQKGDWKTVAETVLVHGDALGLDCIEGTHLSANKMINHKELPK